MTFASSLLKIAAFYPLYYTMDPSEMPHESEAVNLLTQSGIEEEVLVAQESLEFKHKLSQNVGAMFKK